MKKYFKKYNNKDYKNLINFLKYKYDIKFPGFKENGKRYFRIAKSSILERFFPSSRIKKADLKISRIKSRYNSRMFKIFIEI